MQTRFCLPFSFVVFFFHKLLQCYNFGCPGTISHVGFLIWEVTVLYFPPLAPHSGRRSKGSIGRAFTVVACTGGSDRAGFCPFVRQSISVLPGPTLGHLRCSLTDVPPQPNSPPDTVSGSPTTYSLTLETRAAVPGESRNVWSGGISPSANQGNFVLIMVMSVFIITSKYGSQAPEE